MRCIVVVILAGEEGGAHLGGGCEICEQSETSPPRPSKKNTGHSIKPDRSRHGPDPAQDLKVVVELVLGATSHEFGKYLLLP